MEFQGALSWIRIAGNSLHSFRAIVLQSRGNVAEFLDRERTVAYRVPRIFIRIPLKANTRTLECFSKQEGLYDRNTTAVAVAGCMMYELKL